MRRTSLLLSFLMLMAADWPQWRGPNRDGISPETVAQKASEFLMDLHELGEEETGVKTEARPRHSDNESHSFDVL